jgi:hypothetical protein
MFSNLHWGLSLLYQMKHIVTIFILLFFALFISPALQAQCAVCTKTAMQLGEKPAQGLNSGILYLMMTPFAIVGFIGYRWWKGNKKFEEEEAMDNEQ